MTVFLFYSPVVQRIEWEFPKLLIRVRFPAGLLFKITTKTFRDGGLFLFYPAPFYSKKIPKEIAEVGFISTIIKQNLSSIDQRGNRVRETTVKYLIDENNNEK
jgi:hypothetical protein